MKKIKLVLCLLVALAGFAQAQSSTTFENLDTITESHHHTDFYLSLTKESIQGSLVFTNVFTNQQVALKFPWRLVQVEFVLPLPNTNAFTIIRQRDFDRRIFSTTEVVTNVFGFVETNAVQSLTNTVITTLTNTFFSTSTTNIAGHIFSAEDGDFSRRLYILNGDRLLFNHTVTNLFRMTLIGLR